MPKITRFISLAVLVLFSLFLKPLTAQTVYPEGIESDRPGQAYSAFAAPHKKLQVQLGQSVGIYNLNSLEDDIVYLSDYTFRYGLLPRLDIQYSLRTSYVDVYRRDNRESYRGPAFSITYLNFAFRYQLLKSEGLLKAASIYFEVNGDDIREERLRSNPYGNSQITLATKHDLGKRLAMATNLTALNIQADGGGALRYVLNASYNLGQNWGVFADLFGDNSLAVWKHSADAGMYFLISPNVQIDFFFGADYWYQKGIITTQYNDQSYSLTRGVDGFPNFNLFGEVGVSFRLPTKTKTK